MRIDKYLKITRLIKRRTVANDACEGAKIQVNGKVVKSSYQVRVGDNITMTFGEKSYTVEVLSLAEHVRKEDASDMYKQI